MPRREPKNEGRDTTNTSSESDRATLRQLRDSPGKLLLWKRNLCACDAGGRLHLFSPRNRDVDLARRVVAMGTSLESLRGLKELSDGEDEL